MIVTTRHLFTIPGYSTRPGFCRNESKRWARARGLDWRDFVRNGIPAERLEETGDGFALALVAWARKCEAMESANG
jgi:hypothetical protein